MIIFWARLREDVRSLPGQGNDTADLATSIKEGFRTALPRHKGELLTNTRGEMQLSAPVDAIKIQSIYS